MVWDLGQERGHGMSGMAAQVTQSTGLPMWRTQSNTSVAVCKALLKTNSNSNNNKNLMVTYSCFKKI